RAIVLSPDGLIRPDALPPELLDRRERAIHEADSRRNVAEPSDLTLQAAIENHVVHVYTRCQGNVSQTARELDVSRQTARRYLKSAEARRASPTPSSASTPAGLQEG